MSSIKFDPPLIAHRGASAFAPENTLAAFLKAKEQGARWLEFDVMLTADGEAVVIHDETLERTTNGVGNVVDLTAGEMARLDAGSWFNAAFAGTRVPTFSEVIKFLRQERLAANVEIKSMPGHEEKIVTKVLADIRAHWTADMPPPLISSFSTPILQHIRHQDPDALIGMLIHEWFDNWDVLAAALRAVAMDVNEAIMTPAMAAKIKKMNKLILCYTVNQPTRARELFAMGVDAVFTDNFPEMLQALKK
jgi:glycerophosphoryl diester phosphodiesterase